MFLKPFEANWRYNESNHMFSAFGDIHFLNNTYLQHCLNLEISSSFYRNKRVTPSPSHHLPNTVPPLDQAPGTVTAPLPHLVPTAPLADQGPPIRSLPNRIDTVLPKCSLLNQVEDRVAIISFGCICWQQCYLSF